MSRDKLKIGINGFGRMGRLTLRALMPTVDANDLQIIRINDPAGDAETFAHLLNFDSVHGRFDRQAVATNETIVLGNQTIAMTQHATIEAGEWSDCDVVLESSGRFKSTSKLQAYLDQNVGRVVVSAPVKEPSVLNVVMGVNDHLYRPNEHRIVTAASCTTNCIAPAIKVVHETFGIKHGSITTIHDITNTQTILDAPHKDLRRARACGSSLIPTTTGSATAIAEIFPELRGKLDGHAVRVPLTNASLTDCVFEISKTATVAEVNAALKQASESELAGILGFEERPLVSVDYRGDARSSIVDAASTMIVNGTQLKLYLWYDNEWGYANRTADLIRKVSGLGH